MTEEEEKEEKDFYRTMSEQGHPPQQEFEMTTETTNKQRGPHTLSHTHSHTQTNEQTNKTREGASDEHTLSQ